MITDVFASQATFRVMLDVLAHPGRVRALPDGVPGAGVPPALAVPLALADLSQRVAVLGDDSGRWTDHLRQHVSSPTVTTPTEADQVVVLRSISATAIGVLRRGSALDPEQGCRLTLACRSLSEGPFGSGDVALALRGPGVRDVAHLHVAGIGAEVFDALAAANAGFPAGIDTFLVADDGQVAGLPRSTAVALTEATSGPEAA